MKAWLISVLVVLVSQQYSMAQNFKEIYNFNVNDVFQYKTTENGEDWHRYETVEKYQITGKEVIGDTTKYSIVGKELYHSYTFDYELEISSDHYYKVSEINSTLIYVDSVSNYLNKPIGSLVSLAIPYHDSILTRILYESVDGIETKIIGGDTDVPYNELNMFEYSTDTTILDMIFYPRRYKLTYSENLGLIEEDYWGFEYGFLKKLEGYIKNGDTTGIITSDLNFTGLSEVSTSKVEVYPNPVKDYVCIDEDESLNVKTIRIFDLNGKELLHSNSERKLFVGFLKRGIYLIKIIDSNDNYMTFKLLKE